MSEEQATLRQITPEEAREIQQRKHEQPASPETKTEDQATNEQPTGQANAEKKEPVDESKADENKKTEAKTEARRAPDEGNVNEQQSGEKVELPEGAKVVEPEESQSERAALENRIFEMTGGKTKDINEYLEMTSGLQQKVEELSNQKPAVTAETIFEFNKKLQEEKGYDLVTALKWQNTDVDSLSETQRIDYALRVENPDRSEAWYNAKKKRLDIANLDEATLEEKIEDSEITAREAEEIKVERDDLLHRSKKLLSEYKDSFDLNINFETSNPAKAEPDRPDPEKVAKVRAELSQATGKIKTEIVDLDLPLSLGKQQLEISYSDVEKNKVLETTSPDWPSKRYGKEDGGVDFDKMMRDRHRMMNFDTIIKRVAESSAAAAVKAYEKSRDNITVDKEKGAPGVKPSNNEALANQMKQFMQA